MRIPLFSAPQQSHVKMVFLLPVELSNRLPQSVQNTRDPTADILKFYLICEVLKILVIYICMYWRFFSLVFP